MQSGTVQDTQLCLPLPDPAKVPDADVVIYDANCVFCREQVERLYRWDRGRRFTYLPLQDDRVTEKYPDLTQERLMSELVIVDDQSRRHGGAAAMRYLSRRLLRLWWLAPILHLPGSLPLWQRLYRIVAKRRYHLRSKAGGCQGDACGVHGGPPNVDASDQ